MGVFFEIVRNLTRAYSAIGQVRSWCLCRKRSVPYDQYFLSQTHISDGGYTRVPEGAIYIEEWSEGGVHKRTVRYGGDEIPTSWTSTPFDKSPYCPWIWIGIRETEQDLTDMLDEFLVPGNRITLDLIEWISGSRDIIYMDRVSFNEHSFPSNGILIDENDYRCSTIPDS